MKTIRIKAPATIANLVCGFDILGLCVAEPYDIMEVTTASEPGVRIRNGKGFELPTDPAQNTAGMPLLQMLRELEPGIGFDLVIHKQIKPGSGLGSSAASAAGAVWAANQLLGEPFSQEDLIRFALFGEKLASGVKHADNLAPCLFGGITLVRSIFPLDIISLPVPDLFISLVHPQIEVRTEDARQILRKQVLLKDAVRQWGNIAGLVAGIYQNDHGLIGRSLEDVLIEPLRGLLIPGFADIKRRCLDAGALGGGISGSGPSIFMLSRERQTAQLLATLMQEECDRREITCKTYVTGIAQKGVSLLATETV